MTVDARQKPCPQPVILAMKELNGMSSGETLDVLVDEDIAVENLTRLGEQQGCTVKVTDRGGEWTVSITKGDQAVAEVAEEDVTCPLPPSGKTTIAIGTNEMGQGDPELGHILIKGYIYAVTQLDELPAKMIFFNSGAKITIEGSESIEDLKSLEEKGVEIWTCGTCLEFYGIKEKLQVGQITNMYSIAEMMAKAPKLIRI